MGRETAERRDEALEKVEAACAFAGLEAVPDGPRRRVRISPERVWVISGGGGVGTLRVTVELNGAEDAVMTMTVQRLQQQLVRLGRTLPKTKED